MINKLFRSRAIHVVFSMLVILTVSGCSSYRVDFSMNDSSFKAKGKSIAVISGTKEPQNVAIAKLVSDSLRKKSRYQVASATQVSQAIESYPQTIKGPYKSAYFYIDTDWSLGDRKKILDIQHSLGVDYLYVIWAPIALSHNGQKIVTVHAIAQLFEQPNAKEVAKTSMQLLDGDDDNIYLKEGVEEIARQLAEETKMASATKK
ncbi:MAG TPA: hypothetical protein VMV48_03525 [Gallionellaceae bacterium]|nr:hypothetical protein [Gallionellaceae bacterium]